MVYIATFYSHFGAARFKKECQKQQIQAKAMPVPRNLSSSCGTCVRFETEKLISDFSWSDEVEQVVEVAGEGYRSCYRAENS